MSWPVDCANCGTQTLIEGPEDKCLFCGKNASKKEVTVTMQPDVPLEKAVETPAPPKPLRRKKWAAYFEDNMKVIIADYYSMTLSKFLQKWHISTTDWKKLRDKWGVAPKDKVVGRKLPKAASTSVPLLKTPLPPFPPFNNDWSSIVQIEWFKAYVELKRSGDGT